MHAIWHCRFCIHTLRSNPCSYRMFAVQFLHLLLVRTKLEITASFHAHCESLLYLVYSVATEFNDATIVTNNTHHAIAEFRYVRVCSIYPNQIKPIVKSLSMHVRNQ